jgi:FtsH-binding integral membrane protein
MDNLRLPEAIHNVHDLSGVQMSHLLLIACVATVGAVVYHITGAPLSATNFPLLVVVTLAAIGTSIYFSSKD